MRAFRMVIGLVLVLIGFPALLVGAAGLLALGHRDADGGFTARLAPVHADGYAVEIPDVDRTMGHAGPMALLGSGRLRISLRATNAAVLLALGPTAAVQSYLDGVPRAELTAVGFASGDAPVTTVATSGPRTPLAPAQQTFWTVTSGSRVEWQPSAEPLSLVVMRVDGKPGLDVALAVSRSAGWLTPAVVGLLVAGLAGLVGGVVLLFLASEPVLVVEAHRMVEFADRIAGQLEHVAPGESLAVVRRTRGLDLTGELVTVPDEPATHRPAGRWRGGGHTPPELADRWLDEVEDDDADGESPYVYTAT